ncbi:MAG: lytic transglycosylase [Novosphingobium sp. 28-62-57]|uniref:lytic transglycosylase domain-containing protein n=1 Tax=unclassified Novosphingobium TaxID=2644732 RepID=UPI000BCD56F0|nr:MULTISPECIES: lytic transglycosylase domain-containing protein [unclassified Novosphingobium]OYW48787.1 MAG: lytic transglycosylase [Novosphingobium sp. 12-62-10]OYZ12056.1 MAG: lytic transglycosylase [Novosphingobium sp. 28-62-57]
MSGMDVKALMLRWGVAGLLMQTAVASSSVHASGAESADGADWDRARANLTASQSGPMTAAVERWKLLTSSNRFGFSDYSSFVVTYSGFPEEEKLRRYAELSLEREAVDAGRLVNFFSQKPPLTNMGRAQYALALTQLGRPEAREAARAAWRGGAMTDAAESALLSNWGTSFTADDHDARMDALLWAGASEQAARQIVWVSPARKPIDTARLAAMQGGDPYAAVSGVSTQLLNSDPGFVFQRVRQLRKSGQGAGARAFLANRPLLVRQPLDRTKWVEELLINARGAATSGDARAAMRIAAGIDDAFGAGEDVSQLEYELRDDYTSLMWLGGTQAYFNIGDAAGAAPLFWRYGAAARTPGTRSKGFYWAGKAAARGGQQAEARRYFELAAQYADQFYGLLALERLGRPVPQFAKDSNAQATPDERSRFYAQPLTLAVREVARNGDWRTTIRFFKEIAEQQQSEGQHVMVADLARDLGRRDLGVIVGQAAAARGYLDFQHIAFPLIPVPPGHESKWTGIHAITRQESQFAMNAVSHAGARGLMQLMPGTANEQAGKLGLSYRASALTEDAGYNIMLGSGYFGRMLDYYNGSWPLAVAAYNAGPGNVNKFLRANGDPRNGAVDWIEWIEKIPLSETRNYVQRVLENAVVYEAMNPQFATYRGANPMSYFIGKREPG